MCSDHECLVQRQHADAVTAAAATHQHAAHDSQRPSGMTAPFVTPRAQTATNDGMMAHGIQTCMGTARTWYRDLVRQVLAEHVEVPCRKGLSLESPDALSAIVPGADGVAAALAGVDLPRRGEARARTTFSVLHALRRVLGYPDAVFYERYPTLAKYAPLDGAPRLARTIVRSTEHVPDTLADEPWVTRVGGSSHQMRPSSVGGPS
jgi:hypothetical protein